MIYLYTLGGIAIQPDYGLLVPFEGINQFSESTAYSMPLISTYLYCIIAQCGGIKSFI